MNHNSRFWLLMAVFQVAFGLAVFAVTRQYYNQDDADKISASADPGSAPATSPPATAWPEPNAESDLENLISTFPGNSRSDDPVEISRQANDYFSRQQYDKAADLYQKLLNIDPKNVDTYNNLGITLHYLGRPVEALQVLNEGVVVDPSYQRIWLTLGFVNSQVGNTGKAREALTTAAQMGADTEVGQSATQMLQDLGSG
jgi:predicted Zn-dependent protease